MVARKLNYLVLILSVISFVLIGCSGGSYLVVKGNLSASENSIEGRYASFDGHYFKKVKFQQGDVIQFRLSTETENGKISAKILDSYENVVVTLDTDKLVTINKTGSYEIRVEAQKHEGKFMLSWEKTE